MPAATPRFVASLRGVGTCTVLTGILTLALPISIVETNFSREMASFRKKTIYLQIQKTIKRELSVK